MDEDSFMITKERLWRLDWIKILRRAIELRPSSWSDHPVIEWRNASDCLCIAVIDALKNLEGERN